MKRRNTAIYLSLALSVLALACTKRQADEIAPAEIPAPGTPSTVTYTNFVQGLFQTKCRSCHASGGSAAAIWTFSNLNSITTNETRIRRVVLTTRTMPMGGSLSASELKSLQEWFDNKMPQ